MVATLVYPSQSIRVKVFLHVAGVATEGAEVICLGQHPVVPHSGCPKQALLFRGVFEKMPDELVGAEDSPSTEGDEEEDPCVE